VLVLGTANVCQSRCTYLSSANFIVAQQTRTIDGKRLQTTFAAATTTVELEHAQREGVTMGGEETSNQLPEAFDI
jgi:hypothetical protein